MPHKSSALTSNFSFSEDNKASSLQLLHSGSATHFVDALKKEISEHSALCHPFLIRLGEGDFNNTLAVLRDYAHQYSFYSQWFTRYLDGVISNLDSQEHRDLLLHNMEEEKGNPNSQIAAELPHVEIFKQFKNAVGATEQYCHDTPACTTAKLWRELFLQKCSSKIPGVGIAAIGLATEGIISRIYPYILKAINEHTSLDKDASLFFELHVKCDDGHAEAIEKITIDIAEELSTREAIRFGVFSALNLRNAFWDAQLARAIILQ